MAGEVRLEGRGVDLGLTLMDSGQCFLWQRFGDAFGAAPGGVPMWLSQRNGAIVCEGAGADPARDYLDLGRDYRALRESVREDRSLYDAIGCRPGLRVLNQDPWDALVQFVLSANNNINRIRSLVLRLAERYGEAYAAPRGGLHALPAPGRLKSVPESELRALGVGYRAPYLVGCARMVDEGFPLYSLSELAYDEAHRLLTTLPGVGDKVADCVLLFGCRHASAFPVDVWIERVLVERYGFEPCSRKKLGARARERFGPQAGIIQQFLFCGARGAQTGRKERSL